MTVGNDYIRFWFGRDKKKPKTVKLRYPTNIEFSNQALITFLMPHLLGAEDLKKFLKTFKPKNEINLMRINNDLSKPYISLMGKNNGAETGVSFMKFHKTDTRCLVKYIPVEVFRKIVHENAYAYLWEE